MNPMSTRLSRYRQVKIEWKTRNNSIIFLHQFCNLLDICDIEVFSFERKTGFFVKICTEDVKSSFLQQNADQSSNFA